MSPGGVLIHEMFMYMWKRLYQTPITGMQKHEVFTKIVYFEVSIEELLLLVVEREFDLEGKWQQEEEGNACLGDSCDDENVGKEDVRKGS